MAEYIDREAAINAVFGAMADGRAVFPALNNLPAADVRPVVKGRWELDSDPGEPWRYVCNICGEKTKDTVMGKPRANFCPYCGAEMEES